MLGRGAGCVVVGGAVVVAKATAFWRQASLRQFMYSAIMNPTGSGQVVAAWATTAPKGELLKELVTEAAMAVRLRVMSGCIWWAGKRGSECVWCCRDRSVVGNIFHIYMKWRNRDAQINTRRQEKQTSKQTNGWYCKDKYSQTHQPRRLECAAADVSNGGGNALVSCVV